MGNIENLLKQANGSLNDKLAQLEVLGTEKKEIIEQYKNAKPEEKPLIEIEMKNSVEKFRHLCAEVLILAEKVKKLKKHYC